VFAVDTNILIYAHFPDYPRHTNARAFCQRLLNKEQDWSLAWQVVYEYIRITTHPSVHKKPLTLAQALSDLEPYLEHHACHMLLPTPQHRPILEAVAVEVPNARGNFIHDLHYAALMREYGIDTIYTADSDFKKFGFLKVIDPTV
jgi:toxin-antitoxin system PIN domain toxin